MKSKTANQNSVSGDYVPKVGVPKLNHVLVVVPPDLVRSDAPEESMLLKRAITLAKATDCELELLHVCRDETVVSGYFSDDEQARLEQQRFVDREAALMAELVVRLCASGVKISQDTRSDAPRSDAILRKISEAQPDLVMKQSRHHGYTMGLFTNTDWDLIRQSPAHLWFVAEQGSDQINNLVTAVGASSDDSEIIAAADYNVFRLANLIAAAFRASNTPVHAYQTPAGLSTYAAYAPEFVDIAYTPSSAFSLVRERRQSIARKHGQSIEAFAEFFNIEPKRVRVAEGHASSVLVAAASDLKAGLIVMAARNLSRWKRWSQSVTAEPVLAQAMCDVVFVKDHLETSVPEAEKRPIKGVTTYDRDKTIYSVQAGPIGETGIPHSRCCGYAADVGSRPGATTH